MVDTGVVPFLCCSSLSWLALFLTVSAVCGFSPLQSVPSEPLRLDYRTLAALPSSGLQRGNRAVSGGPGGLGVPVGAQGAGEL